jgi:hypothetical protein
MSLGEMLTAIGAIGTAAAAFFAAIQLWIGRRRAQTAFEDSLTAAYRDIMGDLPVEAFMRTGLRGKDVQQHLKAFHRYIDLCNEQVFLRQIGRISGDTWTQWNGGIASNLRKPGFADAWDLVREESDDFDELRRLADCGFRADPREWQRRSWLPRLRRADDPSTTDRPASQLNAES